MAKQQYDSDEIQSENQELEEDQKALWVQIDPYYYLTTDSYNPVILVRFTKPNQTRNAKGEILNNRKWYFEDYQSAMKVYLHQAVVEDGRKLNGHDVDTLKQVAKLIDEATKRGVIAVEKFDQKYQVQHPERAFGQKSWHKTNKDTDED